MATGVSPLPLPHQEGEDEHIRHQSTTLPNKSISPSNSKKPIFNQPKHFQQPQFINDPGISSPSSKQSPTHEISNDLSNPSNYPPSSIFATLKQTSNNQTNQPSANLNQSVEDKGNDLAPPQLSYMEVVKGCSSKRENSSMGITNLQDSDMESISLKPISMYQGKPAVMFSLSEKHSFVEKLKFVLVGKFSHGMPSMVKVRNFFKSIKLKESCNVSFFDKKHIFIECSCKTDYNFIWLNLSWVIDGFAMRILKWTPEFHPVKESPVVPVWIRLEGLPLYLFNERSLLSIANTVGKPLKVDHRNVARTMLNSARICVELDISKPFVDTLWISFEDEISKEIKDGFWVKVLYDVVPPYCGFCSHIGHSIGRCKRRNEAALALGKYVETGGAATVGLGHGEVGDGGSAAVAGSAAVYTGCGRKAGHAAGDAEPADLQAAGVDGDSGAKAGYTAGSGSVAGDEYAGVARNVGGAGERPVDAGKQDTGKYAEGNSLVAKEPAARKSSATLSAGAVGSVLAAAGVAGSGILSKMNAEPAGIKEPDAAETETDELRCSSEKAKPPAEERERHNVSTCEMAASSAAGYDLVLEGQQQVHCRQLEDHSLHFPLGPLVQQDTPNLHSSKLLTTGDKDSKFPQTNQVHRLHVAESALDPLATNPQDKQDSATGFSRDAFVADLSRQFEVFERIKKMMLASKTTGNFDGRSQEEHFVVPSLDSPSSWADQVEEQEQQGTPSNVKKVFDSRLPIDFNPEVEDEEGCLMTWSQAIGTSKRVLTSRSLSPAGRSSKKLTELRKRVDLMKWDDGTGVVIDKDKYDQYREEFFRHTAQMQNEARLKREKRALRTHEVTSDVSKADEQDWTTPKKRGRNRKKK